MITSMDPEIGTVPTIYIDKNVIVELFERYVKEVTVTVQPKKVEYNLELFGSFEIGDSKMYYGTGAVEYQSRFNDPKESRMPIIFVKNDGNNYYMVPTGDFSENEIEQIKDAIEFTLQSQLTMMHYLSAHCS